MIQRSHKKERKKKQCDLYRAFFVKLDFYKLKFS